mmetsp:Transcript_105170/g.307415  ORF Transcript_105170/g.307415 Transcript_105170/m.307415 type:complete len:191 (+) Transcript_105170:62-634(+)
MPLRPTSPIADEGDHWHAPLPCALPSEVEGPNGYLNTMTNDCDSFRGYIQELEASLAHSGESSASSSQTSHPSADHETETSSVETWLGPPLSFLLSQAEVAGRAEPVTDIYWGENIVETGRATFACNFVDEEEAQLPPSRASSGTREAWSGDSPQKKPRRLTDVLRSRLSRMMTKRSSRKVAPQTSSGSQ